MLTALSTAVGSVTGGKRVASAPTEIAAVTRPSEAPVITCPISKGCEN